ncbi:unnamed protein product, partial [Didymodactylos carnosus]
MINMVVLYLLSCSTSNGNSLSCIPNTNCSCYFEETSFILSDCDYALPDLPIPKNVEQLTKIIVQKGLTRLPHKLCSYKNVQSLDLSESYFEIITDLTCLHQLKYLNISSCKIRWINHNALNNLNELKTIDLSQNQLVKLNCSLFKSLTNLVSLNLSSCKLEQLTNFDLLLSLSHLRTIDLTHNELLTIDSISTRTWLHLTSKWFNSWENSLAINTSISFTTFFHNKNDIDQSDIKNIIKKLSRSIFSNSSSLCNCRDMFTYQRIFNNIRLESNKTKAFIKDRPLFRAMCSITTGERLYLFNIKNYKQYCLPTTTSTM